MTFALMYHDLAERGQEDRYGFAGPAAARYKLTPQQFENHLDAIAAAGVSVGLAQSGAQAALTFDDGGASALRAADALERRGWRGHFFITTGRIGTDGFLDEENVAELARRGHDVGSHSHSHPTYMGTLPGEQLAWEWEHSRDVLAGILGSRPDTAAVPGGFLSPDVIATAQQAGYRMLMTSQPTAREHRHATMTLQGRYTIWAATSAARAAAYARGDIRARAMFWLAWNAKSAPKRVSPRGYEAVRQAWVRLRPVR